MTRSMKDYVDARQESVEGDLRADVPVFLPGYSAIGKFAADPGQPLSGCLATAYSIPAQMFRVAARSVRRLTKPNEPVYKQAALRNFEIAITDTEILYCPASPLLLRVYPPVERLALSDVQVRFETIENQMSRLIIGSEVWHVHPHYTGDVRWALRRISDEFPDYEMSFSGGNPDELSNELTEISADDDIDLDDTDLVETSDGQAENEEE